MKGLTGAYSMKLSKKKLNAQKARRDYWRSRAKTKALLDKPEVTGIIDPSDGTLDSSVLRDDLEVRIPVWEGLPEYAEDVDVITLQWAYVNPDDSVEEYVNLATSTFPGPLDPSSFPKTMSIAKRHLADGRYLLRYQLDSWVGGPPLFSVTVPLVCDGTAPYDEVEPPALILPDETITDEYLAANGNQVIGIVLGYPDWQPGDTVSFWWEKSPLPSEPDLTPVDTIAVDGPENTNQHVIFPAAHIKNTGDGAVVAFYALRDKAGNRSRYPKTLTATNVALGPIPIDLQNPVVPFADDDGLIDLNDAIAGVKVQIPAFNGFHEGGQDEIELTWRNTIVGRTAVGIAPEFPLEISVPASILQVEYGSATGEVPTEVKYRVMRGTQPSTQTPSTTVSVDFSEIGPARPDPDPEWPNPVNPALPVAIVKGRTSGPANTLTPADKDLPADIEFDLYSPLKPGEYIEFYWDSELVSEATYTVASGDSGGSFKKVEIPWSYIQNAGNKTVSVHYRIGSPDSTNEQQSQTTLVVVTAVVVTPDAPTYPDRYTNGYLNCSSLNGPDHAIRVQVPDLSKYLSTGSEVTLTWEPYSKRTDGILIEDAIKQEIIKLTDETVKGFEWRIQPYDKHIAPIYLENGTAGRGETRYEFNFNGETVVSETEVAVVAMFNGGGVCELS